MEIDYCGLLAQGTGPTFVVGGAIPFVNICRSVCAPCPQTIYQIHIRDKYGLSFILVNSKFGHAPGACFKNLLYLTVYERQNTEMVSTSPCPSGKKSGVLLSQGVHLQEGVAGFVLKELLERGLSFSICRQHPDWKGVRARQCYISLDHDAQQRF